MGQLSCSLEAPHRDGRDRIRVGGGIFAIPSDSQSYVGDLLGWDNQRCGYTTLTSRLGSTLSWPGCQALILFTDGMLDAGVLTSSARSTDESFGVLISSSDIASWHGIMERVDPFPLLSFSAICIAAGINKSEKKLAKTIRRISKDPRALVEPHRLFGGGGVITNECIKVRELMTALQNDIAASDEEDRNALCELFAGGARLASGEYRECVQPFEDTIQAAFESSATVHADTHVPFGGIYYCPTIPSQDGHDFLWAGNRKAVVYTKDTPKNWRLQVVDYQIQEHRRRWDLLDCHTELFVAVDVVTSKGPLPVQPLPSVASLSISSSATTSIPTTPDLRHSSSGSEQRLT
jgi:hypothetical protein